MITVNASSATVVQGATAHFVATVTGGSGSTAVDWAVQEGATGGSITSAGQYTAPMSPGTFHVVVTLQSDRSVNQTITITVPPLQVSIWGGDLPVVLATGSSRRLVASVQAGTQVDVEWEILDAPAGGLLSNVTRRAGAGLPALATYTAPASPGSYRVRVRLATNAAINLTLALQVVERGFRTTVASRAEPAAYSNTATSLGDTRVLVAGGNRPCGPARPTDFCPSSAASIYDSGANLFVQTGSMLEARFDHSATRLADGRVLIVGGTTLRTQSVTPSYETLASAEIFDPARGTFTATASMSIARSGHVATLLQDGRVLVTGGSGATDAQISAEIFDARTATFSGPIALRHDRGVHTTALLHSGKVLLIGGRSRTAELFDPATGNFSDAGSLQNPRTQPAATVLDNGDVLVIGGGTFDFDEVFEPVKGIEVFSPSTGSFSPAPGTLVYGHHAPVATRLESGRLLVVGSGTLSVEIFDPAAGTSTPSGGTFNMFWHPRASTAVLPDRRIIFVGSGDGDAVEVFQ